MAKITILFGAGAEGKGQFGLPSGNGFKRDIVLANNVASFANLFLKNAASGITVNNGTTISHSSSSILYQTIVETKKIDPDAMSTLFPDTCDREKAERYIQYKQRNEARSGEEQIRNEFYSLYKRFYAAIKDARRDTLDESVTYFLEHAGIYAYLDSLFNYLRKPEEYKKQCARVIKVYYAALVSILTGIANGLRSESIPAVEMFENLLCGKGAVKNPQAQLAEVVEQFERAIVEQFERRSQKEKDVVYYYMIRKLASSLKHEVSCITTNYTTIGERIINIPNEQFSYLHGKLSLFEELETKNVATVDSVNLSNTVFPYLLVQSGVKPIISPYQIREFYKACEMIDNADQMLIVGYGINPDDEHITNLMRNRIRAGKTIKVFVYCKEKDDDEWKLKVRDIRVQLGENELLQFYHTDEFTEIIDSLIG